jgi:hypothetical protein
LNERRSDNGAKEFLMAAMAAQAAASGKIFFSFSQEMLVKIFEKMTNISAKINKC